MGQLPLGAGGIRMPNAQTIAQALACPSVELFDPLDPNGVAADANRMRNAVRTFAPTLLHWMLPLHHIGRTGDHTWSN
jgi:hypothetical protein